MAQKKKPAKIVSLPQTPENQIRTRARKLQIGECYITRDWKEMREANILITRKHQQGGVTFGVFLIDLALFGVKESFYQFNMSPVEFADFIRDYKQGESTLAIDYSLAHNIIYGALDYADSFHFKPDKDFAVSKYILEEDTEDIPLIEVEFGVDGLPTVFCSDEKPRLAEIKQMERLVGKGNYQVINLGARPKNLPHDFEDEEDWGDDDLEDGEDWDDFVDPEVVDQYLAGVHWKEIYRQCDAIFKLKPWKKLMETDVFAIKVPVSGKEFFVSVMGSNGEVLALSFYQGGRAIHKFWEIHDPEVHAHPIRILAIPHIMLSWENKEDLEGTQAAIIEKLGITYQGKLSWPQFHQVKPGFVPDITDIKEFKDIEIILDQCLEVLPRIMKDPSMLWENPDGNSTYLFRIPKKSGKEWIWREAFQRPINDPGLTKIKYNPYLLLQYSQLPVQWKTMQLELQLLPIPITNNKGIERYPLMLIGIDPKEDYIVLNQILDSSVRYETLLNKLPDILFEHFIETGSRPGTIEFRNLDLHMLMQLLEDLAKTKVVFKKSLDLLDSAVKELIDTLTSRRDA